MNENVKRIARKAALSVNGDYRFHIPPEFTEKFARLLIEECATIIDTHDDSTPYSSFGDLVKSKFGITDETSNKDTDRG